MKSAPYTLIILSTFVALTLHSPLCTPLSKAVINLDEPPNLRYTPLAHDHNQSISAFLSYLHTTLKYQVAFTLGLFLTSILPLSTQRAYLGYEFYEECASIATAIHRPVSQIIIFNYMYQLGAFKDFCTSIPLSSKSSNFLGRNLDYGYQQFLSQNSLQLEYYSKGKLLFTCVGHAGLVGCHTAIKYGEYSITLNERIQGGFHLTLLEMLSGCETAPYTIRRLLASQQSPQMGLEMTKSCAPVYFIVNSINGSHFILEKQRGVAVHSIQMNVEVAGEAAFMVQTNNDRDVVDPDGRKTAALTKLRQRLAAASSYQTQPAQQDIVKQILSESPNFNTLTLLTVILDTRGGTVSACVWQG